MRPHQRGGAHPYSGSFNQRTVRLERGLYGNCLVDHRERTAERALVLAQEQITGAKIAPG